MTVSRIDPNSSGKALYLGGVATGCQIHAASS
jgi:hypothetical protein